MRDFEELHTMPPKKPQPQRTTPTALIRNPKQSIGWLFMSLWLLRIANAITLQTFFQPDEFFQSLEPAWRSTFGPYSNAWITWEWKEGLRSSVHPLIFAMCYKVASIFGHWLKAPAANRAEILILLPKMLQAAFAALTDLYTYLFACKLYGSQSPTSIVVAMLTVLSPWNWFAATRTFSNSLEATLTTIAIYYWPWDWVLEGRKDPKKSQPSKTEDKEMPAPDETVISLTAAAWACILRPTNLLVWATITFSLVFRGLSSDKILQLAKAVLSYGGSVLVASVAMDKHFYGAWIFPPFKFAYFNVVQSLAVFYGKNRIDYYFTEGLPLLLTTALPFAAIGMWKSVRVPKPLQAGDKSRTTTTIESILASAVVTSVLALSTISHKEVRFLFPLLPLLHILAAKPLLKFLELDAKPLKKVKLAVLGVGIAINVGIAIYTSHFHQRGVVEVTHYLRHEYEKNYLPAGDDTKMTVGFLMPCHSTPWRSHLVYPDIDAWALTCEPPLHLALEQRGEYLDEADVFYADPEKWIEDNMENLGVRKDGSMIGGVPTGLGPRRIWPEYLVFFDQLRPMLESRLDGSKYVECWREFNTHWHDDWRRKGDVVFWCMR